MKEILVSILDAAIRRAREQGDLKSENPPIGIEAPRDPAHGDAASNVAFVIAKAEGRPPSANAAIIVAQAQTELPNEVEVVEAKGGFINFRMAPGWWHSELRRAAREGASFWRPRGWALNEAGGKKVQVEFLSANPTGPLTVGHGRNAVLGDAIARLYEAAGFDVTREYYFNDGGRQMKLLGESVRVRYLQEHGIDATMPEDGYQGEYIREIARDLPDIAERHLVDIYKDVQDAEGRRRNAEGALRDAEEQGDAQQMRRATELLSAAERLLAGTVAAAENYRAQEAVVFRDLITALSVAAVEAIFADIKRSCEKLKIHFNVFTNELDLMKAGLVDKVLAELKARGLTIEKEGAIWLRAEPLGLPKDAVLVRSGPGGEPTYRTPDIAYHIEKLKRGFNLIVDVFGADHIDEHRQVIAAVKALGYDTSPIRAIIYQFVTLTRAGEKVKMSTRKATYVTLDELIDEVGADVVRFFFLFRKHDSHLDFDLDLAKKQAPENPVFYVQYAHARLASVFREAEKAGLSLPEDLSTIDLARLSADEIELAKRALALPDVMTAAAEALEPHRVPFHLLGLAGEFHRYYNQPENRIIGPDRALSMARLFMAKIIRAAIAGGLELLGVSAPERM